MGKGQSKSHEQEFNYGLGEVLRDTTVQWKDSPRDSFKTEKMGELKSGRGKRVDILVDVDGLPVVAIETSYDGKNACDDAMSRISEETVYGGKMINTSIAVEIPDRFRKLSLSGSEIVDALRVCDDLRYAMYQYLPAENDLVRLPECGFFEGSVFNLSHLLNSAVVAKEVVDDESGKVALLVRNAAERLEEGLSIDDRKKLAGVVYQRTPFKGLQTISVLWLNALLTMQRLHKQGVVDTSVFSSLGIGVSCDPRPVLDAWQKIWEKNWRSIFGPAITALEWSMRWNFGATAKALGLLVNAVQDIELMELGPHVHIGAELFPKLSEDRKETAAFYTQPSTAELLATLTIRPEDVPNKGADLFDEFRVADLACGTGTLLRAGYQQIKNFHEMDGGDKESVKQLHKTAMERGLVGVDISPIATHFASSSLAAIGMGEPYRKNQIGWVDVGEGGRIGALDFLDNHSLGDLFMQKFGQSLGGEVDEHTDLYSVVVGEDSMDVVLMNPPYTMAHVAFNLDWIEEPDRDLCKQEWKRKSRNQPVNLSAGMAASFLALARQKVRRGGRIGFVLPLTAAFADSWAITRQMLEYEFEDITAVVVSAGQALGKNALSADTNMEEMLLTATRRRDKRHVPSPIRCVTLRKPPIRLGEAREIGRAILKSEDIVYLGDEEIGQIVVFDGKGDGRPWGPLGVVHPVLAIVSERLCEGILSLLNGSTVKLNVDIFPMSEVFDIGPTRHLIGHLRGNMSTGGFALLPVSKVSDRMGPDRVLWAADCDRQTKMLVPPTHKGVVVDKVLCKRMRESATYLFYAQGMGWASNAPLAPFTEFPTLGGRAFTSLGHADIRVQKAGALWFNSIFGMLVHWTQGSRTQPGRAVTFIGAIKKIPCPFFSDLSDDALDFAVRAFDRLKNCELKPACQAHVDDVRDEIDRAVIDMFGLPKDVIDDVRTLRELWCKEPSVHGNNKTALRLLGDDS